MGTHKCFFQNDYTQNFLNSKPFSRRRAGKKQGNEDPLLTSLSRVGFCSEINMTKSSLGRKVTRSACALIAQGSRGRCLKVGTEAQMVEELTLPSSSTLISNFSRTAQAHLTMELMFTQGWVLRQQLIIKELPYKHTHRHSVQDDSSVAVPFSKCLVGSQLTQANRRDFQTCWVHVS